MSVRESIGARDDIWTRTDKVYDIKMTIMICLSYTSTEVYTKMFSHFLLELNTFKNVAIEQEMYCFYMQIQ